MHRIFILASEPIARRVPPGIRQFGYTCYNTTPDEAIRDIESDLVLVEAAGFADKSKLEAICSRILQEKHIPVILLVMRSAVSVLPFNLPFSDFIVEPYECQELGLRIKRLLTTEEVAGDIKCGDLSIDLDRAEVYLAGRPVELTFREYELLLYLIKHQGRVFSREALLNAVWGYDYFGGDRTVDVHIRRLRGKLEDSGHCFIDTVRNMGYRFRRQE